MSLRRVLLIDQNRVRRNYTADVLRYSGREVLTLAQFDPTSEFLSPGVVDLVLAADLKPFEVQNLKDLNSDVRILLIEDDPSEDACVRISSQFTPSQLMHLINKMEWEFEDSRVSNFGVSNGLPSQR